MALVRAAMSTALSMIENQVSAAAPQARWVSLGAASSSIFSSRHEGRLGTSKLALTDRKNAATNMPLTQASATRSSRGAMASMERRLSIKTMPARPGRAVPTSSIHTARPERRRRPLGARSDAAKLRPRVRSQMRSGNISTSAASVPSSGIFQPFFAMAALKLASPWRIRPLMRCRSRGMSAANFFHSEGDRGDATLRAICSLNCWVRIFSMLSTACLASTDSSLPRLMAESRSLCCCNRSLRCCLISGLSSTPSAAVPSWAMRASSCLSKGSSAATALSASRLDCSALSDRVCRVSAESVSSSALRMASSEVAACSSC